MEIIQKQVLQLTRRIEPNSEVDTRERKLYQIKVSRHKNREMLIREILGDCRSFYLNEKVKVCFSN